MIQIQNLVYGIAGRTLFDGATAHVPLGRRAALVGRNGEGKTTLLRLIEGLDDPESGSLTVRSGARIGTVSQEPPGGTDSVLEFVLAADRERSGLLRQQEHETDGHRIAEIQVRLTDIGSYTAPARAAAILAGLGFEDAAQARAVDSFSGGWRMRIALAAVLFATPDLLLLDEPTNHLDLEAVVWLEGYLRTYDGTLVMVSHDRTILNRVPQMILHLESGRLSSFNGGYDAFERVRSETIEHNRRLAARDTAQRAHMQTMIDRFRYKATRARQAQSRIKALAKRAPVTALTEGTTAPILLPKPPALASPVLTLEGVAAGYGDLTVLKNLDLRVDADDRIALLGANGNGKTTLARLLAGHLAPQQGTRRANRKLRPGYFTQDSADTLVHTRSAVDHLAERLPDASPVALRAHLGSFGLTQTKAVLAAGKLSGGERSRLALALIAAAAPALLILDEPTNHLDIDSRGALIEALNDFSGALVLISHDRQIIELCSERLWLVAGGTVSVFEGTLDGYESQMRAARVQLAAPRTGGRGRSSVSRRARRQDAARRRSATASNRRAAADAEDRLAGLSAERDVLDRALAQPDLYAGSSEDLTALTRQRAEIEAKIEQAEQNWIAAQEALEIDGEP